MHLSDLFLVVALSGVGQAARAVHRRLSCGQAAAGGARFRAAVLAEHEERHRAAGGLQVLLPANRKDLDQVALDTTFGVGGDFDIVATYEIMKADAQAEELQVGVMLSVKSAQVQKQGRVGWMLREGGKEVAVWDQGEAKTGDKMSFLNGAAKWDARLGRLRLRRTGESLEQSIAVKEVRRQLSSAAPLAIRFVRYRTGVSPGLYGKAAQDPGSPLAGPVHPRGRALARRTKVEASDGRWSRQDDGRWRRQNDERSRHQDDGRRPRRGGGRWSQQHVVDCAGCRLRPLRRRSAVGVAQSQDRRDFESSCAFG